MIRVAMSGLRLIALVVIGAAVVGAGILAITPPRYEATARILVDADLLEDSSVDVAERQIMYSNYRTVTIKTLTTTDLILDPVIEELSLDTTSRELANNVTALSALDTSVVDITVASDDAASSADIANAIGRQVSAGFSKETSRISLSVSVVQEAVAPNARSGPNPVLVLALSAIAGFFLALAFLLARHSLAPRVRDVNDVLAVKDSRVLGTINSSAGDRAHYLSAIDAIAAAITTSPESRNWSKIALVTPTVTDEFDELVVSLRAALESSGQSPVTVVHSEASLAKYEAVVLDSEVDAVLVVVPLERTAVSELSAAVSHLALSGTPLSGFIITEASRREKRSLSSSSAH
ncbi:hypothetical protein FFT87_02115 [Salinibacterium sp. M195]|nr:hypothetical protein FFT87_02115 [Salinibacterium sp. M195]